MTDPDESPISPELRAEVEAAWRDLGDTLAQAWPMLLGGSVIDPVPLERALASNDEGKVREFIGEANRMAGVIRNAPFVGVPDST